MVRVHAGPQSKRACKDEFNGSKLLGGLAQLARAPALHAGGHRFDSDILHNKKYIDILELIEVVNK